MFKTILVSLTGFDSDASALDTAYLAARHFDAHIQCLHVRTDTAQLATKASVYDFGTGASGAEFFAALEEENEARSKQARLAFADFCKRWRVTIADNPPGPRAVSARWREISGDPVDATIEQSQFHDVVVLGRPPSISALSLAGIGAILVGSGRPVLIAPQRPPENLGSTIAFAWKETPEAARALTASMPLLLRSKRILVLSCNEKDEQAEPVIDSATRIAEYLQWNGLKTEVRMVLPEGRALSDAIVETACALGADLMVMGGYSHSRVRELVFGGFTRRVLAECPLPVLLFH